MLEEERNVKIRDNRSAKNRNHWKGRLMHARKECRSGPVASGQLKQINSAVNQWRQKDERTDIYNMESLARLYEVL